ncbi:hypothetical protein GQ55_3G371300 [Panicum hallii var. hallii]|uniref:Uncharacterized protein n=1 Tax=Panicum hallii var. hallii TaxID=1504633 RepID=A0A2T7EG82_9POAL|nr:hypothetical protein GQ55_3G371300 [Panicum hallii var. hallii]
MSRTEEPKSHGHGGSPLAIAHPWSRRWRWLSPMAARGEAGTPSSSRQRHLSWFLPPGSRSRQHIHEQLDVRVLSHTSHAMTRSTECCATTYKREVRSRQQQPVLSIHFSLLLSCEMRPFIY